MCMHVYLFVPRGRETKFFRRDPMAVPRDLSLSFCFVLFYPIIGRA